MHEMKWGKKSSTLATGLMGTMMDAFSSFDPEHGTESQSWEEILPVEPPDVAGFYKYGFKISAHQRFILAYFYRQ